MSNLSMPNTRVQGWKEHFIKQGNGNGGWRLKTEQCQIMRYREKGWTAGFGLAQMDNGEIVLLGMFAAKKSLWYGGGEVEKTIIAFSSDRGDTWSEFESMPGTSGRPMMLAYLGGGNLTYVSDQRYFSSDYGRTWSGIPAQPAINGGPFYSEGNPLIDRDERGMATRIAEIGWNAKTTLTRWIRWSADMGRTWTDDVELSMGSEGALVRARNGWLVAALRCYSLLVPFAGHDDSYRSTRVSISRDEGKTWSSPQWVVDGRMQAHLLDIPNGDIVMTLTKRHDFEDGKLASYSLGCEALISHDNGLTWDLKHKYILDEWEFFDSNDPDSCHCGHLYSALLDDGSILTVHNNYLTMGMTLIHWRP